MKCIKIIGFIALVLASCSPEIALAGPQPGTYAVSASADVGNNTAQIINKVVDKASGALGEITSKLEAGAPKAWALVVEGTKATAEATILIGLISLAWSILSWVGCFWNMEQVKDDEDCVHIIVSVICGISGVCATGSTMWHLMDSSVWAAYFSPQGYLALQVLQQALSH